MIAAKAHQRLIRERYSSHDSRLPLTNLDGCTVRQTQRGEAEKIILKYEWLGTMGRAVASYGLFTNSGEIIGAAVFGWPGSVESRDICGTENRHLAICLERGACVHYAPSNAASYLISQATQQAANDHNWRIFYAYADPEAGEIGTVYQACNWLYIGQGVGRTPNRMREDWQISDTNPTLFGDQTKIISSRSLRHRGLKRTEALAAGWTPIPRHPKHKYIQFAGSKSQRRALRAALRYPVLPYPKRTV